MQLPFSIELQKRADIQKQIVQHLREMIQQGALPLGSKLPSTRRLSEQLRVSRGSVVHAYQNLLAEGYVETQTASATFVSRQLPETFIRADLENRDSGKPAPQSVIAGTATATVAALRLFNPEQDKLFCDFRMGRAEKSFFPMKAWRRLIPECLGGAEYPLSQYGDPAGYGPLRKAICDHILRARGVRCTAKQVIIVAGCQEGLNVIARTLVSPGDAVAVEDPCYQGAAGVFDAHHARLLPIPVDDDGLDIGLLAASDAKLVYVTPSHQFPLGSVMPRQRRMDLIGWAERADGYVIEDDYDSDFRYERSPLSAVKAFDTAERVIYVGTFSKSIGAGLRLGYVVMPPQLLEAAITWKSLMNNGHPWLDQAVMAEFMRSGAFEKHLGLIRKQYLGRRNHLISELHRQLPMECIIKGSESGMHLAVQITDMRQPAHDLQMRLKSVRIGIYTLKESPARQIRRFENDDKILLLGYAGISEAKMTIAISRLCEMLN